jgi:cellulose synthase/poly-beta-1,6-N-acetylglucosamine synthase-like glycosyltransferase
MILLEIILTIAFLYLTLNALYLFVFASAAVGKRERTIAKQITKIGNVRIAVFIPAYKEDSVILSTAESAANHDYSSGLFDVIVIADQLKKETLAKLAKLNVKVVEVNFEKSTKSKALNAAMDKLPNMYDVAVVLDADNQMQPGFLSKVSHCFASGSVAMQGHRVAKNSQIGFAALDGLSEEINNSIFRKGHVRLGLSSALIGSGMAFDYQLFKDYMSEIHALGGFDKELEIRLLRDRISIDYLEDAIVLDEKVSKGEVFENQRTRWISAQIKYGAGHFLEAWRELLRRGNLDFFDKVLQFWLLPRAILVFSVFAYSCGSLLSNATPIAGIALCTVTAISLLLASPKKMLNKTLFRSLLSLPEAILRMAFASLKYKKAQKNFIHTPHQN